MSEGFTEFEAHQNRDQTFDVKHNGQTLTGGRRLKQDVAVTLIQRFAERYGTIMVVTHRASGRQERNLYHPDGSIVPYLELGEEGTKTVIALPTTLLESMESVVLDIAPPEEKAPAPAAPKRQRVKLSEVKEFDVDGDRIAAMNSGRGASAPRAGLNKLYLVGGGAVAAAAAVAGFIVSR